MDELGYLDEYENEEYGFVIDTPQKANWAVRKIKEARQRRDLFNSAAQNEIEELQNKIEESGRRCDSETGFLMSALAVYLETVPAKESKTQKTFILPEGKLKKKFASRVFKADEEKLAEFLANDEEYIKVVKKPIWGEFKKLLKEVNGNVIRTDTGEIVEGVIVEERPEVFDIE